MKSALINEGSIMEKVTTQVIQLEHDMWEAALHKDAEAFSKLVLPEAVMVCGGYRCSGSEYAGFIRDFDISGYSICDMEVISASEKEVTLHYVLRVEADNADAKDLEGLFHVVSIWKRCGDTWNLVFNMDSRIAPV